MAKYINQSQRVFVIGEKHIIPGGEGVELTADEVKNTFVQSHIENGNLVKVPEVSAETAIPEVIEEVKTTKK